MGVGRGELELRRPDEALVDLQRSIDLSGGGLGWEAFINQIQGMSAFAEFQKGTPDAIEKARATLDNAHRFNDEFGAAVIAQLLSGALISKSRFEEARPLLHEAIGYFRPREVRVYLVSALEMLAAVERSTGQPEAEAAAREELATLKATFTLPPPPATAMQPLAGA